MTAYGEIDFPHGNGRLRAAFENARAVLATDRIEEIPALLSQVEDYARQGCWATGFVAYEAAAAFDAALRALPGMPGLPLAWFAVYDATAPQPRARGSWLCGPWRDVGDRGRFDDAVAAIRRGIADGDFYQVNYTTRLRAAFAGDSLGFFDALRASQPSAGCAYLDLGRFRICSVSPESFFDWSAGELACRPMKGTAARGADAGSDAEAATRLRQSPKERAENLMIVDLIRNDLSKVARLGTVSVPSLFAVEEWPTVWQMTSTVKCRGREDLRLPEIFSALFPCGSVTGAPKAAAMAAIAKLEQAPRGVYCGAVGVVKPGGEAQFCVGIRTVLVDADGGRAECGIGSGIVMDSQRDAEYAEWQTKRAFLDRACPPYELLETMRLHQGRYWLRRGHLRRLARSAAALGFVCDAARIDAALDAAARRHRDGRARLRLAPDGGVDVDVVPLDALPRDPVVAFATAGVASQDPRLRHKTTRRGLYEALTVRDAGIFDTLLCNERGEATEFTRGNLVASVDGRLLTPPLESGLLPGVLREALLARKRIREAIVTRDDAARADRLWFINSVRGALPVRLRASVELPGCPDALHRGPAGD